MVIVTMERTHLAQLAALEQICFSAPWSEDGLASELGKGIFLVALEAGEVQGYVGCQAVLDEGYITNVAVLPQHRRKGIALELVQELLTKARVGGLSFVTLEVRESNTAAKTLYDTCGFTAVGKRSAFYRNPCEDALLMTAYLKGKRCNENISN